MAVTLWQPCQHTNYQFTVGPRLSVFAEWITVFAQFVFIKSSMNMFMLLKVYRRMRWYYDHENHVLKYGTHCCLLLVPYSWKHSTLSLLLSNRIMWSQWSTSGTTTGPLKICTTDLSSNQQWRTPGFQTLWLMGMPQTQSPLEVKKNWGGGINQFVLIGSDRMLFYQGKKRYDPAINKLHSMKYLCSWKKRCGCFLKFQIKWVVMWNF